MKQFKNYAVQHMDFNYRTYFTNGIVRHTKQLDELKKELRQNENKISSMKKKSISLEKKVTKETNQKKKIQFDSERQPLENDIKNTSSKLPDLRFNMGDRGRTFQKERRAQYISPTDYSIISNFKTSNSNIKTNKC